MDQESHGKLMACVGIRVRRKREALRAKLISGERYPSQIRASTIARKFRKLDSHDSTHTCCS